jgi:ABC-type multidrug transport system ATPase subunit
MERATSVCLQLFALLLAACGFFVVVWLHQRYYRKQGFLDEQMSKIVKDVEAFSAALVKNYSGRTVAKYCFQGLEAPAQQISIGFQDVGLELQNGQKILQGVTGTFEASRISAIMGPSGAGKTSFLNALCGKAAAYGKVTGSIRINGLAEGDGMGRIRNLTGFVPQEDVVNELLTVRENIHYSAALRCRAGSSYRKLAAVTEDVLQVMQIDQIQNSLVGGVERRGISGGQKKRVNVGMELAACPTVLFLDEPTSGLDSTSALALVNSLSKMAEFGMTIIMVVHQPRYPLFTLFDDVLLLGKGGRTVYQGPAVGSKPYFKHLGFTMPEDENPADWVMDCIAGEVPNTKVDKFEPPMLFDMWLQRKDDQESWVPPLELTPLMERVLSTNSKTMRSLIREEWMRSAHDSAELGEQEFTQVLTDCTGATPDKKVVLELMGRISGERGTVTQEDFTRYLICLTTASSCESCSVSRSDLESGSSCGSAEADEEGKTLRRQLPGFCCQLRMLLHRRLLVWWRLAPQRVLFLVVLESAAVLMSVFGASIFELPPWYPPEFLQVHMSLALLISVYSLGTFTQDQPIFWRESSHNLNRFAYFLSKVLVGLCEALVLTFFYTATYFLAVNPGVYLVPYFTPFMCVGFVAACMGYCIACWTPAAIAPFLTAIISFVEGGLLGEPAKMGTFFESDFLSTVISVASYTRWSVPLSFLGQIDQDPPDTAVLSYDYKMELDMYSGYYAKSWFNQRERYFTWCVLGMLFQGSTLLVCAYLGLTLTHRSKQL